MMLLLGCITLVNAHFTIEVNNPYPALDYELYENVLDAEQCQAQIEVLQANTLLSLQCKCLPTSIYWPMFQLLSCVVFSSPDFFHSF